MGDKVSLWQYEIDDYNYNEAIKTLRKNIQYSGRNVKVMMLTSSFPGEGKSETAFQLAVSMAQLSKRVLYIDADIRKSVLVSRYWVEVAIDGLSQYLSGQVPLDKIVNGTTIEGLDIISAGPYSPNPAELLEESLFASLIEWGRENYDYIIIDTPPITNLIDGVIIANHCDGAVLVIESEAISYRILQRNKQQIENSGCRILGVVLNKVNISHDRYYRYYGKYGKYGKYENMDEHS